MVSPSAVVALVALQLAAGGARRAFRQVATAQGAARGYLAPRPPHYAFLGLPYARAPTSDQRFKAPGPPPTWDGIFEATHRVRCVQDGAGDENCLVVNVFVPVSGTALPVVVVVHDGQFQAGQGAYEPPERLLNQGTIIVTFNYRLGVLGFLCLGTPEAPGNAGLKDQVAAIYWVQKNIASFGGDPQNVTLYGIRSGAIAIHLLLLSGLTEGLFHKVILESGSALSPSSLNYEPVALAMSAAVNLGYEGSLDVNELGEFFHGVPVKNLSYVQEMFLPCIEHGSTDLSLLDWDPIEVLKKGSYQQVPIIMMYSEWDGAEMVTKNTEIFDHVPEYFEDLLPTNLRFNNDMTKSKVAQFVKEFYFDNTNAIDQNYADYFHDVLYEYPVLKSAILYAEQCFYPVFVLKFSYKTMTRDLSEKDYEKIIDLLFAQDVSEEDELVVGKLITLLSNFIKLGDPTPIATSQVPLIWQPVEENSDGQLNIRTVSLLNLVGDTLTMISTADNHRMTFWDHIYENFYRTQAPLHDY